MKRIIIFITLIILTQPGLYKASADFNSLNNISVKNYLKSTSLLKKYIENLKKEVILLQKKYDLQNDTFLKSKISRLNNMIYYIERIKQWKIDKNKIKIITNNIISELKVINPQIKNYIKIKINQNKYKVNLLKNKYSSRINILVIKLQNISNILANKVNTNFIKKNEYLRHIKKLNSEIRMLKDINWVNFKIKKEFWIYLKDRIIKIKYEFYHIKKILKLNKK